jgi:hypothetical protein
VLQNSLGSFIRNLRTQYRVNKLPGAAMHHAMRPQTPKAPRVQVGPTCKVLRHEVLLEALNQDEPLTRQLTNLCILSNCCPAPGMRLAKVILVIQQGSPGLGCRGAPLAWPVPGGDSGKIAEQ